MPEIKAFYYAYLDFPQKETSRYPLEKFRLLLEQVVASRLFEASAIVSPPPVETSFLALAHSSEYIRAMESGQVAPELMRQMGFPYFLTRP